METKIQFKSVADFNATAEMVKEMNMPEWHTTVSFDKKLLIMTFNGMSKEDVLFLCFGLRTCLTADQAWVIL